MIDVILISLEILFLGAVGIMLLRLRGKYGLVPFYMFLAASLIYGEITTPCSLFTFLGFDVAGTAVTIIPLMLFALIIIQDIEGIEETRKYIFGLIMAILLIIPINLMFLLKSRYMLSPLSPHDFQWLYEALFPDVMIDIFSILGFIVSVFVLIVIYNFLTGICNHKFLCVFIALSLALYADSLIVVGGLYLGGLATSNILYAHIATQTFASFLYSLIYILGSPLIPVNGKREIAQSRRMVELDETTGTGFGGKVEGSLTILVAEDSPDSMDLLKHTLQYEDNWKVVMAKNGKEALGMVFAENPDIILLDVMMPEMDGYQVVKILKSHKTTMDIPIIMITAKIEKEDKLKGMAMGIDDYITKPFIPEEVVARIRMVLRRDNK